LREAKALMMAYGWPGNVRELGNVIERMIVVSTADVLDVADLPSEMRALVDKSDGKAKGLIDLNRETTDLAQKQIILKALTQHDWNVTRTAKSLGITRATLQNKMKTYGIRKPLR
jgi:two-component system, NtrC family, nitrogen regulation response regulator NtrX